MASRCRVQRSPHAAPGEGAPLRTVSEGFRTSTYSGRAGPGRRLTRGLFLFLNYLFISFEIFSESFERESTRPFPLTKCNTASWRVITFMEMAHVALTRRWAPTAAHTTARKIYFCGFEAFLCFIEKAENRNRPYSNYFITRTLRYKRIVRSL